MTHHGMHSRAQGSVCLGKPGQGVCGWVNYRGMTQTGRCGRGDSGEALNRVGKVIAPPFSTSPDVARTHSQYLGEMGAA